MNTASACQSIFANIKPTDLFATITGSYSTPGGYVSLFGGQTHKSQSIDLVPQNIPIQKKVTGSSGYIYLEDYHPCLKYPITNPVWKIVRLTDIKEIRQILKTTLPDFEQSELANSIEEMNNLPYPVYFSIYDLAISKFDEQLALSSGVVLNLLKDHVYDPWYRDMADFKVRCQKEHSRFSIASMDNKMWECQFTTTVEKKEIGLCLFMLTPPPINPKSQP